MNLILIFKIIRIAMKQMKQNEAKKYIHLSPFSQRLVTSNTRKGYMTLSYLQHISATRSLVFGDVQVQM